MATKRGDSRSCRHCTATLPLGHDGACPQCGQPPPVRAVGRRLEPSSKSSLASERRKDFYEQHKLIAIVMILIIFIAPILGVLVNGVPGLLVGMVLSVGGYYVLPYAVPKLLG